MDVKLLRAIEDQDISTVKKIWKCDVKYDKKYITRALELGNEEIISNLDAGGLSLDENISRYNRMKECHKRVLQRSIDQDYKVNKNIREGIKKWQWM